MRKLLERYPVGAVLLLTLVCISPFMALRDVTPANELRYLSIADEALRDGHLFAFYNHGVPYADKPPLYFWLLMLGKRIFGGHSIYLLSLLFSFLPAAVVTVVMDRWVFGAYKDATPRERTNLAMLLCSTAYWLSLSLFLRMDMLLAMFIVLALYAWHRDKPWLFALFTFLGLFTKGLVGLLMPPLTVAAYALSCRLRTPGHPRQHAGRFLGWRFLLLVGGCSAIWLFFAWREGGAAYIDNLLFHQTVDRAVNAFHHKEPFWFYLTHIWPALLPWCLLVIPACIASLCRRGTTTVPQTEEDRTEKTFRCAFFSTLVMLSCASSKLSVYLLPAFPFAICLVPLYVRRTGWKRWMDWAVGSGGVLAFLIGVLWGLLPFIYDKIPALAPYTFATNPLMAVPSAFLICGGIATFILSLRYNKMDAIRPLGVAVPAFFLALAPLLPEGNEFLGYRSLCRDIPEGVPVYTHELRRPENMDVFLGRSRIFTIEDGDAVPADGVFIARTPFEDPVLKERTSHVHGKYTLWLPADPPDPDLNHSQNLPI